MRYSNEKVGPKCTKCLRRQMRERILAGPGSERAVEDAVMMVNSEKWYLSSLLNIKFMKQKIKPTFRAVYIHLSVFYVLLSFSFFEDLANPILNRNFLSIPIYDLFFLYILYHWINLISQISNYLVYDTKISKKWNKTIILYSNFSFLLFYENVL